MLRTITTTLAGAILTLAAIAGGMMTATHSAPMLDTSLASASAPENIPSPQPRWMRIPCEFEDSPNCYWNAGEMGNGRGHSFYSITAKNAKGNLLQCTIYWEGGRYARRHNHCIGN